MNDDIASVPRAIAIARRTKKVMLQAVLIGLGLAIIGMIAAAFNLIPVVVGAFMQEAIDVVSILWALTVLFDRGESADCASKPRISPIYGRFGVCQQVFRLYLAGPYEKTGLRGREYTL